MSQARLQAPDAQAAWSKVQNSVILLTTPMGARSGVAALIDDKGLFLADRASVLSDQMMAKTWAGEPLMVDAIAVDDATQLVLLKAKDWVLGGRAALSVATDVRPGATLIAVLTTGAVRCELSGMERTGLLRPSLRYMPLNEIHLETPLGRQGGGIAISLDGKLVGVLSATLDAVAAPAGPTATTRGAPDKSTITPGPAPLKLRQDSVGPTGLTVSYALGRDVLQRVVEGFRSPTHLVKHPSIGAFWRDATVGAVVVRVLEGSAADKGGLKENDVIVALDGQPIANSVDLAGRLFRLKVGQDIRLRVRRGQAGDLVELRVVVGSG